MAPYNLIQVYFIALHCTKHHDRVMMMMMMMMKPDLSSEMKAHIQQTKKSITSLTAAISLCIITFKMQ